MRSRQSFFVAFVLLFSLALSGPAFAAGLQGHITDHTGGVLPGVSVRLLNVANGIETTAVTDGTGRYAFTDLKPGLYRVATSLQGFSDASRSVIVSSSSASVTVDFVLALGAIRDEVTVTAARGARDTDVVPLRTDTVTGDTVRQLAAPGTGDVLVTVPGVTPVGSGPFQVRPRLRGLDSTRVLVLVDGERLNNARTATDRAGVEVGLVDPDSIEAVEVLGGAGSVLYGTDALSGTINIITNRPSLSDKPRFSAGFDGLYSSNEKGRRGTVSIGMSTRRIAVNFMGGAERYDDYRAGSDFNESSVPFFTSGRLAQVDTIDTNFGFNFHAFPEAFNAPFTRTSALVPMSAMEGTSANLAAVAQVAPNQRLDVRYQRRNATNVGFPDFQQPYFFQTISLPYSKLEKFSAAYTLVDVAAWMPKVTATLYVQHQDRLLRNDFPVQFPAPSATFFPISVFRLNILSDTRQEVWTPGLDVQATFLTHPTNLITAGLTTFEDRSRDQRTTTTQMNLIGSVGLGAFGPAATVFGAPIPIGPPTMEHPVRVPDARFRDVALFIQDEWDATRELRLTGGLRLDAYRVTTMPTTGYDVESLVEGATPAIDPSTLPGGMGDRISRNAVTGELGAVLWSARPVSLFGHYVHSYRHPNLEELLFSGPATTGNIVPNVKVEPETGHNVDVGLRFRASNVSGSVSYFNNRYHGFISTEVVANSAAGSISQAINLAAVRIQGIEAQVDAPFVAGRLAWAPYSTFAWNRGTVLSGTSPLSGVSLAGAPQDNITPWKYSGGLRVGDRGDHWWALYGVRSEGKVTRVSPLLSDSPFLIAQDLFGLNGFTLHRVAFGYDWRRGSQRIGVTLSVDNLADRFYREQFQFAPARGRSISLAVHIRGIQ